MAPVNTYHKAVELWSREQAPKAIQGQRTEMNFKALAIRFIPETMTEREAGRIKKAVLDANPDATKTLILRRKAEIALPSLAYLQDDQPVNTSVLISEGSGDIVEWSELDEVEVWEEAIENALAL